MISLGRLIAIARKWQRVAGIKRKAISLPRMRLRQKHKVADKGHFVVYSIDKGRLVIPLAYLRSNIFKELFRLSEEESGLPSDGPITFPCDAAFMDYLLSFVRKNGCLELQKAVLLGLLSSHHCVPPSPHYPHAYPSIAISGAS